MQNPKKFACNICRRRKLKCDGERPVCMTCKRLGHACGYEERQSELRARPANKARRLQSPNISSVTQPPQGEASLGYSPTTAGQILSLGLQGPLPSQDLIDELYYFPTLLNESSNSSGMTYISNASTLSYLYYTRQDI